MWKSEPIATKPVWKKNIFCYLVSKESFRIVITHVCALARAFFTFFHLFPFITLLFIILCAQHFHYNQETLSSVSVHILTIYTQSRAFSNEKCHKMLSFRVWIHKRFWLFVSFSFHLAFYICLQMCCSSQC